MRFVMIDGARFTVGLLPPGKKAEIGAIIERNWDSKEILWSLYPQRELVRFGVRGHEGLFFEDGSPVMFETSKEVCDRIESSVVSDSVMDVYAMKPNLILELMKAVQDFNWLRV